MVNDRDRQMLYWDAGRFFDCAQGRRIFVLKITAYLDESQVTEETKHVVIAGFYGENANWDALGDGWMGALKPRGRKSLHMTDLRWNSVGSEKKIKPLLEKLGSLPYEHKLTPIYGATKVNHFADLLKTDPEKAAFAGYIVCFSQILGKLCVHLPAHASLRVICEAQTKYQELAGKMFHLVARWMAKKPENPWLDEFGTVPKGSTFMTEPADYLAFAIGKFLDENGTKKDSWCRPIFNGIDPNKIVEVFNKEQAREATRIVQNSSRKGQDVFQSEEFEKWLRAQGRSEASLRSLSKRFET
jgi:hypothetical protein